MSEYLLTHFDPVQADACDYNGHMNEAQALVLLTVATDTLLDRIGLDDQGRQVLDFSAFTVQNRLHYRAEAHTGDLLIARTRLLGFDEKRLRIYHQLLREPAHEVIVEMECLLLGVDTINRRAAAWPDTVSQALRLLADEQHNLGWPEVAGQEIDKPALGQYGS
ncbi:MAG: thioesterase family protein [Marinobacterium sp.]|nr:thioesterase family protein [Marinobacterium sp.]